MWRERGWEIFQAIESKTKTAYGYASVYSVDTEVPQQIDAQPRHVDTLPLFKHALTASPAQLLPRRNTQVHVPALPRRHQPHLTGQVCL